jgi:hypothetical protein
VYLPCRLLLVAGADLETPNASYPRSGTFGVYQVQSESWGDAPIGLNPICERYKIQINNKGST